MGKPPASPAKLPPPPAKRPAAAPAGARPMGVPGAQPAKADGTYRPLWFAIIAVVIMIISPATVIVAAFGMMPTVVAYIVDRTDQKYAAFCVGSLNFCGVFPFILEVWTGDNTPSQAFQILTNVFKLLMMYGAASMGWMLYSLIPPIVSIILVMVAQRRVEQLKQIQEALVAEWGPEVSEPPKAAPVKPAPPKRRRRAA
jgi:hypothetical protein